MKARLTTQMRWQGPTDRLLAHRRPCDRWGRLRRFGGLQLFQRQLKLRDLVVQRFRGASELHPPQPCQLQPQPFNLKLMGAQFPEDQLECGVLLAHQPLECLNVVGQIAHAWHAGNFTRCAREMLMKVL